MVARVPNPYRPGFNQQPVVLAGRDEIRDGVAEAFQVAAFDQRTPRPIVLVGTRGMGKTVLLGEIANRALEDYAWLTVHVEAKGGGHSLIAELLGRLGQARTMYEGDLPKDAGERQRYLSGLSIRAFGFGLGVNVGDQTVAAAGEQPAEQLRRALLTTMEVAAARTAGLVITLDEIQAARPDEVAVLGGVLQESVPEGWPLVVAIAALPTVRVVRGPRRLPTYLERAEWHELRTLAVPEAREALGRPADRAGRPMTSEAVQYLGEIVGGYPYAIQVAGHYAWRASHASDTITMEHARAAEPAIRRDLDQLIQGRWDDASVRERDYLAALARLATDPGRRLPTGARVAEALGESTRAVSYLRDRLIKKGTITALPDGSLEFILPGMAQWVRDRVGSRG